MTKKEKELAAYKAALVRNRKNNEKARVARAEARTLRARLRKLPPDARKEVLDNYARKVHTLRPGGCGKV